MIGLKDIYNLQSKHEVDNSWGKEEGVKFSEYVAACRDYLAGYNGADALGSKSDDEDSQAKYKKMIDHVTDFVNKHKVRVKGYYSEEGVIDTSRLLEDLIEDIAGVGALKVAFKDPDVDEVQINDLKTMYVMKNGVLQPYVDERGQPIQFSDNSEISILLNRLIDDGTASVPQLTPGHPILNAKTAKERYRVNAVHCSANARDLAPWDFPMTSVVIRKVKPVHLTLEDIIKSGAMTRDMGRLTTLIGRAGLKTFCVGPTGSGKTTLLNIIAQCIPQSAMRIILVQNPTEIVLFDRDQNGFNKWNAVHWEVREGSTAASLEGLASNTLRQTPDIIIVGEAREPADFKQIVRITKMGHIMLNTFHAGSVEEAVERMGEEIGGTPADIRKASKAMDIVYSQFRFPDGSRKIMELAEVLPADADGTININTLYKYEMTGKMLINPKNGLPYPEGKHVKVGGISERLQSKFFRYGVSIEDLKDFL